MKIVILLLCLSVVSAALLARDLKTVQRRERERREALSARGRSARSFDDSDLVRYRGDPAVVSTVSTKSSTSALSPQRDLAEERAYWKKETLRHRRDLERMEAGIRRLELRLAERRSRRRPGDRAQRDASAKLLEESLASLREERRRVDERFRERARRAGAFPGWLR